ncbi:glycoside hydrolase family 16 protein [Prauserella cavernicola]|uniref:Glycoside hydrolase family 16 protein n=1 Tax=Prauserella cavernicola TaxID=2800127 RepID=A0A934V3V3_9PSEU|nr:glycoside hydrolase family 16 protein [Prauserella cavernicola]MBK1783445.1 glycoside hydrolase family 16 protein [Prauserella cavernicola]
MSGRHSPRRPRRLRLGIALAALTATALTPLVAHASQAAPERPRAAATTFEDNFDGPAGQAVDGSKWNMETGDGVNNFERQYYTDSTANAALDGQGNLVITARRENPANYQCWYGTCEYTSARLNTSGKFSQTHGHFEARIKMSEGQGMWPAFWMLGDDFGDVGWPQSGEIDIMENVGYEPNTVHGTIHGPGYSAGESIGTGHSIDGKFADEFHTFAVDWSPERIVWSVDGTVFQTLTPADVNGNEWVFEKPFFMILNLAVGGQWPGDPDGNTRFPNTLTIDYVRVTDTPQR